MRALRFGVLLILAVLEVGLIASGGRYPLPRREAELRAFRAYMQDTSDTAKRQAWVEQRRRTNREILISRGVIYSLAVLNGVFIVVLIRSIRTKRVEPC